MSQLFLKYDATQVVDATVKVNFQRLSLFYRGVTLIDCVCKTDKTIRFGTNSFRLIHSMNDSHRCCVLLFIILNGLKTIRTV